MAIYKLGAITTIKRGSSPRPIHGWLVKEGLPWAKISDLNNNEICATKEFVHRSWRNKGLIGNSGDLFVTNSATPGVPFIQKNNTEIAYHDGFLKVTPNESKVLKKYLLYKLIIDRPKLLKMGNGAVFINLSSEILKKWEIEIPTLTEQQQIIDIIEQNEKLFLTYSNCVRIDSIENAQFDMKNLIDIIEPVDLVINKLRNVVELLKKVLVKNYNAYKGTKTPLTDVIELVSSKYEGQKYYLATNSVGNMVIDYSKAINVELEKPSRAAVSPIPNSFIISKLIGENKIYFFNDKPKEVYSTGFFNFKAKHNDLVLGFLLSDDFTKQKEQYSTGTTMVGLNNDSLSKISIKMPHDTSSTLSSTIHKIELQIYEFEKLKKHLISILITK